ncbi:MAG TPA: GH116 family glycosyl-hydrolase, partial [Clostridia bacterium]|nr:GH116 family glycosyl-hydrolase [Clostridia bacterium]
MIKPRSYPHTARLATFPLGGIGTGTLSIGANGALCDAEFYNTPNKGHKPPFSFFAVRASLPDGKADARVLEAGQPPDYDRSKGWHPGLIMDLPRMNASSMAVRYPLRVRNRAFTPFIPLQADDSGLPMAAFDIFLENPTDRPVEALVAFSFPNLFGYAGGESLDSRALPPGAHNQARRDPGCAGIYMDGEGIAREDLRYANYALLALSGEAMVLPLWYRGGWSDGIRAFWRDFVAGDVAPSMVQEEKGSLLGARGHAVGSVLQRFRLAPGEHATASFMLAWYVPNRPKGWTIPQAGGTVRNHYATLFADAWDVARYFVRHRERLTGMSLRFADALYASALPEPLVDALAANLAILRSNTCFRLEDGSFLGWEGCHAQQGSCPGTCTHVWNYAQAAAFLFPELERSARRNEFLREVEPDGKMCFRSYAVFGQEPDNMPSAVDGQLGTLVRLWREYCLCGDLDFLAGLWDGAVRAMDYVARHWDPQETGLIAGAGRPRPPRG